MLEAASERWRAFYEDPLRRRAAATVWLVLCIRAAHFVPLPGFSRASPGAGGPGNVVNLLLPTDLGDLTGAQRCMTS